MFGYNILIYLTIFVIFLFAIVSILLLIAIIRKNDALLLTEVFIKAYNEFMLLYDRDRYFSKREFKKWFEKWEKDNSKISSYVNYTDFILKLISKTGRLEALILKYKEYFLVEDDYDYKITYVSTVFHGGINIVKERNETYIETELIRFNDFFDTIESNPLTLQQRKSVIIDEAHNLIVAGAGTGKTSTIVAKTGYLIEKGIVKPEEILMLSFGDNARKEMLQRILKHLNTDIEVRTFHSLGYDIIGHATGRKPPLSDLADDASRLNKQLEEFLQNRLEDYTFLNSITKYFAYYLRPVENVFDFESEEEYEEYLRQCEIRTLQGEKVKSYEECMIANFLFKNGIRYEYEKEYFIDTASEERRQYQPDFYLSDYRIWIEHFGIDRGCNTAPDVDKWEYLDEWYWKRKIHGENWTYLIETYSYENSEGVLIENLRGRLGVVGVKFNPISQEEIFQKLKDLGEVSLFIGLVSKFLILFKSNDSTIADLRIQSKQYPSWKRYHAFLDVFEPLYEDYESYLHESARIDFNDMINQVKNYIADRDYIHNYKYVLVDEFQDISQSRYRFLKSILDQNDDCQLFCVGDDWQSIYRFTGSDISIMTEFEKYFDPCEVMFLDETFRFNDSICEFSSNFIKKNPAQYDKELKAKHTDENVVSIVWYEDLNDAISETLEHVGSIGDSQDDCFIIGRYNLDFYRNLDKNLIKSLTKPTRNQLDQTSSSLLSTSYTTVHKSKGQQADFVILIGLRGGMYGFPCEIEDDPVLNLVLSQKDMYPNSEERRVFYVAITRAKKGVYLLADRNMISSFISEIVKDEYDANIIGEPTTVVPCPICDTGVIIKIDVGYKPFYSCSKFPVCRYRPHECPDCKDGFLHKIPDVNTEYCCSACSYTARICPECKDGYLVLREKDGSFWGCSNYGSMHCTYTEPVR